MTKFLRLSTFLAVFIALLAAVALRPVPPVSAACTNSGDYPAGILADTPFLYYRMGEAAGTTATNTGSVGVALNGTYSGVALGATSLVANDANTAVNFNGTTSFMTIPNHVAINTGGPYQTRTIEFIFGAFDTVGRQLLFEEGGFTRGLNVYLDGATLYMGGWNDAADGAGSPWGPFYLNTPITADTVYHVALVFNGNNTTTGTLTGYVNGVSIGTTNNVGQLYTHTDGIGIARTNAGTRYHDSAVNDTNFNFFNGRIDEFAMYNAALSSVQINAHITDCFPPLVVSLSGQTINTPSALLPWAALFVASIGALTLMALRRRTH
jgi:hypothetical protein